jgi:hypothetical protein
MFASFRFGKNVWVVFLKSSNFNDPLNQHKVPPHFFFDLVQSFPSKTWTSIFTSCVCIFFHFMLNLFQYLFYLLVIT